MKEMDPVGWGGARAGGTPLDPQMTAMCSVDPDSPNGAFWLLFMFL